MFANPTSDATWNVYVGAEPLLETAFRTVSVIGCAPNPMLAFCAGVMGTGVVSVTPVLASVIDDGASSVATTEEGLAGALLLVQAEAETSTALTLQTMKDFVIDP